MVLLLKYDVVPFIDSVTMDNVCSEQSGNVGDSGNELLRVGILKQKSNFTCISLKLPSFIMFHHHVMAAESHYSVILDVVIDHGSW